MKHRSSNYFNEIKPLKAKQNVTKATELLSRLSSNVTGVMDYYNWKVGILSEFYPKNKAIYGLNMNRGQKIFVRLRSPTDENTFLDYDTILHTMLHELCHINHSNHSAAFYSMLDELSTKVTKNGPIITSSSSSSTSSAIDEGVKNKMKDAAIKRSNRNSITKNSGNKLGGTMVGIQMSKEQLKINMADAAERRNKDNLWCPFNNTTNLTETINVTKVDDLRRISTPLDIMWECDVCGEINADNNESCAYCQIKRDDNYQIKKCSSKDIEQVASDCSNEGQNKRRQIETNYEITNKSSKKSDALKDNNIIDLTIDDDNLCFPCK